MIHGYIQKEGFKFSGIDMHRVALYTSSLDEYNEWALKYFKAAALKRAGPACSTVTSPPLRQQHPSGEG